MATTNKLPAGPAAPPAFDDREMSNASTRFHALSMRIREARAVIKLLGLAAEGGLINAEIDEKETQAGAEAAARLLEHADAMLAVIRELHEDGNV